MALENGLDRSQSKASRVIKISDAWRVLPDAQAAVEFTGGNFRDTAFGDEQSGSTSKTVSLAVARWGNNNLLPQEMFRLVFGNHLKPQLISTSRDFLLGSRLGVFRRVINEGKWTIEPVQDAAIEDWLEEVEAEKYMRRAAYNLEFFGNVFTAISLNAARQVEEIRCFDATDIRAEKITSGSGRIENYFLHPDWSKPKKEQVTTIPAYDKTNPVRFAECLYHGRDETPGQSYYDIPPWWGTRTWSEVSNLIPEFHKSGLLNGYNLKYHIEIPMDYFKQFGDAKAQIDAEEKLMEDMNKWLAGVKNANKAFISKFATDHAGKSIPGFKITSIENKIDSAAYNAVDTQANIAHTSGHGILPSLAGIDTGSKLGGSGSELRLAYQMHIALHTPIKRAILLEPFNKVVKKINNWNRELIVGFEDVELTTLSENPTGQQSVVNQSV